MKNVTGDMWLPLIQIKCDIISTTIDINYEGLEFS